MTFTWPVMLFSLLLAPPLVVLYLILQRRRQRAAASFVSLAAGQEPLPGRQRIRAYIPAIFFLVGITILMVAMARPQMVVSLPKVEGTVILGIDVSGSMVADDLKPNRLEAAKTAARDFVERQPPGVQIGVVAFSDNGIAIQQPSYDRDEIVAAINRLSPTRGTSLGNSILASLKVIAANNDLSPHELSALALTPTPTPTPVPQGTFQPAVIILLTDGENNESPDPMAAAQAALDRGVRIYTVGIGSPGGATIKINGINIHTQLDEPMLQQIAQLTGGDYYNAQSEQDLLKIYDNLAPQFILKPEKTEVTSIFAGLSIIILLVGSVFSLFWFGRLP